MLRALRRIGTSCLPCFVLAALLWVQHASGAEQRFITVASTTSTQDSGLFGHILPLFATATGIEVRVIAVGTGQAVRLAERGDADVLLVHHRASEEEFVKNGYGVQRIEVMYNDFVLVGTVRRSGRDERAGRHCCGFAACCSGPRCFPLAR